MNYNSSIIFLSYASEDREHVSKVYEHLKEENLNAWMDIHSLLPGEIWEDEIRKTIIESEFVLIFLSHNSVNKKGFIAKEIALVKEVLSSVSHGQINVIPVRLDDCPIPDEFSFFQSWDLFKSQDVSLVSKSIKKKLNEKMKGPKGFWEPDILSGFGLSNNPYFSKGFQIPRDTTTEIGITFNESINGCIKHFTLIYEEPCLDCNQTGYIKLTRCPHCLGKMIKKAEKSFDIQIPQGVYEGEELILRNELPGDAARNISKDLVVKIKILPHRFFTRKENDIYCIVPLKKNKLEEGTKIRVKTIYDKKIDLKIPPGTQSGKMFKIKGFGVKTASCTGSQYVKIIEEEN